MRILYFSRDYTTHDRRFLLKLAQSRHEVWYLRLEDDGILYEEQSLPSAVHEIRWSGGKSPASSPEDWLQLAPAFERVLVNVKPDLIQAGPVQSCGFLTALMGAHPLLIMSWGSDILVDAGRNEFWEWLTRYALARSDALLCDCSAVRARVQEVIEYPDAKIVQFPWGIDLQQFAPGPDNLRLRERQGWENSYIVLSTRAWEPIYGVNVLLEAFRKASADNEKLRLVLLGSGPLSGQVADFIDQRGMQDIVYHPGQVPHSALPDYFRSADLYVSCSHSDGTSISLLEALSSGLPVVVTDAPGNREWISPGQNGWLVQAGDVNGFARALIEAISSDDIKIRQISEANREIARERADWDVNFEKLLNAYERLEEQYFG